MARNMVIFYVDASDESRKIAASDFTADLCTGQQLIFIAAVADMTHKDTKPQIMFKPVSYTHLTLPTILLV